MIKVHSLSGRPQAVPSEVSQPYPFAVPTLSRTSLHQTSEGVVYLNIPRMLRNHAIAEMPVDAAENDHAQTSPARRTCRTARAMLAGVALVGCSETVIDDNFPGACYEHSKQLETDSGIRANLQLRGLAGPGSTEFSTSHKLKPSKPPLTNLVLMPWTGSLRHSVCSLLYIQPPTPTKPPKRIKSTYSR